MPCLTVLRAVLRAGRAQVLLRYLQEGYFDTPQWSWPWRTLTAVVGNPEAVSRSVRCEADAAAPLPAAVSCPAASPRAGTTERCAECRFVELNLNRLFANLPTPLATGGPAASPGLASEHKRAAELARAIQGATAYLDLHSTSADTPPFAFQQPGCAVTARFAASFPVAYTIDDPTIVGKVWHCEAHHWRMKAAMYKCVWPPRFGLPAMHQVCRGRTWALQPDPGCSYNPTDEVHA